MKNETKQILTALITEYPKLTAIEKEISTAFEMLIECYTNKGKVLLCGNGGSAADCEHIVGELMKSFKKKRPLTQKQKESLLKEDSTGFISDNLEGALPAVSLVSGVALATAFINDVSADLVYAQQVFGLGRVGDILIGISTSGNAVNVNCALKTARALGMKTIGMTGDNGGEMNKPCDSVVKAPQNETYLIQELHLPIYHTLCAMLEEELF